VTDVEGDMVEATAGDRLFVQVGAFLAAHRLSPLPQHYAFAYDVVAEPHGVLARRVAELTDGGVRLSAQDIVALGGTVAIGAPPATGAAAALPETAAPVISEDMVARMLAQIDGFTDTVRTVHHEANGFGRDLQRSAATLRDTGIDGIEEIARLTDVMIERVRAAEARLEQARRETEELRGELDEARGTARTDPLTELPNRRAFDEAFAALDGNGMATVAICDIDHFKSVNDRFGHAVGDRVICAVADTLARHCKGMVARYGGEEFALLFAATGLDDARRMIEHARREITARNLRVRETGEPIGTVSFSAGATEGRALEGRAAIMARADAALYLAKNQGRACTIVAP
jgi:diguanylate cyclase